MNKKVEIGDCVEEGVVPCLGCDRPHDNVVTSLRDNGDILTTTWATDHVYNQMSDKQFIQFLLLENADLRNKIETLTASSNGKRERKSVNRRR